MRDRIRTSAVVLHNDQILTFRAVDPDSGREYFFLPGGEIEKGETPPEAAERETFEETGFQVQVDPSTSLDKEYVFRWNGEDYKVITIFYRATLVNPFQQPTPVKDADYNKGVHWIPKSKISEVFSYTSEIRDAITVLAYS
jgi:tRNA(adenine34) deaminase